MIIIGCKMFENEIERENIIRLDTYKRNSFIFIILRKIYSIFKITPNYEISHIKRIKNIDETIIIFDSGITKSYLNKIDHLYNNSTRRLILWYWNPIDYASIKPKDVPKRFEKWSYSIEDCRNYNLNYNTQFYFFPDYANTSNNIDILFVGNDKGRFNILKEYKKYFDEKGFSTYFHITKTHRYKIGKDYKKPIPYKMIQRLVEQSKVVLDIYRNPSAGPSLRVMEGIFYQKKVITNNITFDQYSFYNESNVFVLKDENMQEIDDFISRPFEKYNREILKYYTFNEWIKRFDNKEYLC